MTFEQIVLLYLYQNKKLSLSLFGTIELEGTLPEPDILKKEKHLPVEGLKFTFNPQVITDQEFIHFYASEKGRIIPLAASDIELQLHMAKQIVNIGNPFDIPGVGKIVKKDNGILTMIAGFYINPPISGSGRPAPLRERAQAGTLPSPRSESSRTSDASGRTLKTVFVIVGTIAFISLVVWAIFQFLIPMMQTKQNTNDVQVVQADTSKLVAVPDTLIAQDSLPLVPEEPILDSNTVITWKAYIRQNNDKANSESRLKMYKGYGHNVFLEQTDSNIFSIYIPLESTITDTARKRDSLSKFFAQPVKLEAQKQ